MEAIVITVSSSTMVPTPRLSAMVALVAESRLTLKASTPSNTVSLVIATVMVCVMVPGAKVREPVAPV